jgi:hypothetical protein
MRPLGRQVLNLEHQILNNIESPNIKCPKRQHTVRCKPLFWGFENCDSSEIWKLEFRISEPRYVA